MTSERGADQDWPFIQRAQNGDPEAFGQIYTRWLGPLTKYVARRVDRDSVEDIVATTFSNIWAKKDTLAPIAPFGALIYAVARHLVSNYYREQQVSNRSMVDISLLPIQPINPMANPETVYQDQETAQELLGALGKLPIRQRIAVVAHHIDGLSLEEVAELLDTKLGTVKAVIHRGKERLRRYLQPTQSTLSKVA